jgi:hypothetical protein
MSTYVWKNDQQTGPYEEGDVIASLCDGTLSAEDLAWREGMQDWQPLGILYPQATEQDSASIAITPPLASDTGTSRIPYTPPPQRHGCLTAWLSVKLVANVILAVLGLLMLLASIEKGSNRLITLNTIIIICCTANVVFAVALFKWRLWGFFGFIVTSVIILVTNLAYGASENRAVAGFLGIGVLYWVLNMGDDDKAWPHLK